MSVDPTADLFKAVGAALNADTAFAAAVGERVYSEWGVGNTMPLVRMNAPRIDRYDDDCGDGAETEFNVHVYSRNGPVERSQIAERVREVLHDSRLTLDNASMRNMDHVQTINAESKDDPVVTSAVVRFNVITIVEA